MGALVKLNMSKNKMAFEEAGKALGEMLAQNSVLKELDVSDNAEYEYGVEYDGPGFAKELAAGLSTNGALSSVNILKNDIKDEALQAIEAIFMKSVTLKSICGASGPELDLSSQHLNVEDAKVVAVELKYNEELVKFDISNNTIYGDGAKELATALTGNQVMTELNIASNNFGWNNENEQGLDGVFAMSNAISTMGELTKLNISSNSLWPEGGEALAVALKGNDTIRELNLSKIYLAQSGIRMSGVTAICNAISTMGALTSLNITKNDLRDTALSEFRKICKSKRIALDSLLQNSLP